MLQPGQNAPVFTLPDADMQAVELSSFLGKKHIVLYFYPRHHAQQIYDVVRRLKS